MLPTLGAALLGGSLPVPVGPGALDVVVPDGVLGRDVSAGAAVAAADAVAAEGEPDGAGGVDSGSVAATAVLVGSAVGTAAGSVVGTAAGSALAGGVTAAAVITGAPVATGSAPAP